MSLTFSIALMGRNLSTAEPPRGPERCTQERREGPNAGPTSAERARTQAGPRVGMSFRALSAHFPRSFEPSRRKGLDLAPRVKVYRRPMHIKDLAERGGVSVKAVRYYEAR